MAIKTTESQTINFLRLFFCVAIVFLHAYTSTQPWEGVENGKPVYEAVTYMFSLQWGEVGVPVFFVISGYLFFYNTRLDFQDYKRKIRSRVKSLLIPYLFWNFLFIALFFVAEQLPVVSQYFSGVNKRVSDYSWLDFVRAFWDRGEWQGGNGTPFDWPLWFVRNLFCLCLLSPVLKYFICWFKGWGILALLALWYWSGGLDFLLSSVLFFVLGGYFSLIRKELIVEDKKYLRILSVVYPVLFLADFFTRGEAYHLIVHRTAILGGIFFFFYLAAWGVEKGRITVKPYYGQLSFLLYVVHNPVLNVVRKATVSLFPSASDGMSLLLYFADVFIVIGGIAVLFFILQKYFPAFLRFSAGR